MDVLPASCSTTIIITYLHGNKAADGLISLMAVELHTSG
jgi:hypothetical protein